MRGRGAAPTSLLPPLVPWSNQRSFWAVGSKRRPIHHPCRRRHRRLSLSSSLVPLSLASCPCLPRSNGHCCHARSFVASPVVFAFVGWRTTVHTSVTDDLTTDGIGSEQQSAVPAALGPRETTGLLLPAHAQRPLPTVDASRQALTNVRLRSDRGSSNHPPIYVSTAPCPRWEH